MRALGTSRAEPASLGYVRAMSERRVVLVTGSTDGIGRATARGLAAAGIKVIVHGRSKPRLDAALDQLRGELPGAELAGVAFDLGSQAAVRIGAAQILEQHPVLHVLVNNAGIFADERTITEDQVELTFAVNYLGPVLLAELLAPRLIASATPGVPSRIINVSSIAHTRGQVVDLSGPSTYSGYAAYAQSKLAQVMHAITLAERNDPATLVAYSLHPGVISTKLLRQGFGPIAGSPVEVGAKTAIRLAAAESVSTDEPSGSYFAEGVVTPPAVAARDPDARARLWAQSAALADL